MICRLVAFLPGRSVYMSEAAMLVYLPMFVTSR